jgi:hypothetical protein
MGGTALAAAVNLLGGSPRGNRFARGALSSDIPLIHPNALKVLRPPVAALQEMHVVRRRMQTYEDGCCWSTPRPPTAGEYDRVAYAFARYLLKLPGLRNDLGCIALARPPGPLGLLCRRRERERMSAAG